MVADRIEREIVINASRERVWQLLTEADHLSKWFGDSTVVEPRPGGALIFTWSEFGSHHAVIERMEEPAFFSYRWARRTGEEPAVGNSTLVEFTLVADGSRTRLLVVETGFAALALTDDEKAQAVKENTEGWLHELDELKVYAE
jgi:uncharacterized protein YndB with AHSA1/START domain